MTVPQNEKAIDAAVADTFPASDPAKVTPDAGLRADTSVLRASPSGAMALRHLAVAGLQALRGTEAATRDALQQLAPRVADPEFRSRLGAYLERSEPVLMHVTHALASFGQGYRPELRVPLMGAAPGLAAAAAEETPGAALDCAIAVAACLAERQKVAQYETLLGLVQAIGGTDAARLLEENLAEAKEAAGAFAHLIADRTVPEAIAAAQPALPAHTNLLAFGAEA